MTLLTLLNSAGGADVPYLLEIAFASNPGSAVDASSWQDVTARLERAIVTRQRNYELDRMQAGTASFVWDDAPELGADGGALDPTNISSPYYPNVVPMRRIRFRSHRNGVTYHRFSGYVTDIKPAWAPPRAGKVEMQAVDGFEILATTLLVSDAAALTTALAGANNDLLYTARTAGGQGDDITVAYVVAGTNTPLTVNVSGTAITVNVATNGAGAATSTAAQVEAAVEANADAAKLVTVASAPSNNGTGTVTAMAATPLAGGKFPAETTGARMTRVLDRIGWPAADRALDAGTVTVVAKGFAATENVTVLQHLQDLADSELGVLFSDPAGRVVFHDRSHRATDPRSTTSQATFSDDGTGFDYESAPPALDRTRILNEVTVTAEGGVPQTASDAASVTRYRKRSIQRATQATTDAVALELAQAIVAAFKDALVRFDTVEVAAWDNDPNVTAKLAAMLSLEISDRATIRVSPPTHTSIVGYDVFVEGLQDVVDVGRPWRMFVNLSPTGQSTSDDPGGGGGGGGALKDSSGDDFVLDSGTAGVLG